ncbi:Myosin-like protein [Globisporangium polare]
MEDLKEHAKAKLLISTLQKYGYDLQDPMLDDQQHGASADTLSPQSALDGLPSPSSLDESYAPRPSTFSSASILQLRERKNNQTALHIAVRKGHVDVLRALAKLPRVQDHVNAGDRHANTALHFAASSAKDCAPEMVELLLGMGASVKCVNVRGQTPLAIHILTARSDNASIAKQLVKKNEKDADGLDLNALINGTTYLHMAAENNLLEIAGALITGGASINVPDHNGATVADVIPKKGLVKLICYMKEGSQVAPSNVVRKSCKICKNPKGLLETLKDCNLCGRAVCKNDSQKASEIQAKLLEGGDNLKYKQKSKEKEKEKTGRLCTVCCTVVLLRDKQHKAKEGFNQKLFGGGMK